MIGTIGGATWITLVAIAFVVCYRSTSKIAPRSRLDAKAWLKASARSFPWAFLFAPSMVFGAIAFPAPAGYLAMGYFWRLVSHRPYLQGPQNATGPIACVMLTISWALIFAVMLFRLRLGDEHDKKSDNSTCSL